MRYIANSLSNESERQRMAVQLRPIIPADAEICGRIIHEAFKGISERHNFRPDFHAADAAIDFAHLFINDPSIFGVVAESDGQIIGSNFLSERDAIRSVGPITIDPAAQGQRAGRRLMEAVIERGQGAEGIRLVQDSFNTASLSLYASLGFEVKEPLVIIEGAVAVDPQANVEVRSLQDEDMEACAALCRRVIGAERTNELNRTRQMFTPFVALRDGRMTAYGSALFFWPLNHAVAETEDDMEALLSGAAAANKEQPLSFILPTRQAKLFRWCLSKGMRVIKPMTLMAMGQYQETQGCYLPSVGY
jgi:predicted N-acetyltransferase YhbS